MSTRIFDLTGTGKWVKPYPGQEDTKYGVMSTMDFYPDKESMAIFKGSGSRIDIRKDDSGQEFLKLTRKVEQIVRDEPLGYPQVVTKNADGKYVLFDKIIGNGSKVSVKISVYDSKFGPGTRWEGIEVIDLVSYDPDNTSKQPLYAFA